MKIPRANEYIYFCPKGNPAIVTKGTKAEIKLVENTDFGKRGNQCADRSGFRRRSVKGRAGRSCRIHEAYLQRSSETTQIVLHTTITLEKDSRVRFVTEFDNTATDHRIVW